MSAAITEFTAISGGFNLLPYRMRKRREVRRRRLAIFAAACVAGGAAVGGLIAWDALEHARIERQREAIEASLRASDAQEKEHARLTSARAESRRARQAAQPLAAPRDRFITLLEALADTPPQRGIALQRVSQRTDEVELAALAPDSASASQWLKRLEGLRGVQSVEVVEMKRRVDARLPSSPERYEFVALVRYVSAMKAVKGAKS
jgi:Tfp pilus assembly protein PilN